MYLLARVAQPVCLPAPGLVALWGILAKNLVTRFVAWQRSCRHATASVQWCVATTGITTVTFRLFVLLFCDAGGHSMLFVSACKPHGAQPPFVTASPCL